MMPPNTAGKRNMMPCGTNDPSQQRFPELSMVSQDHVYCDLDGESC